MKNNVLEVLEYFPNKVRECLTKYEKVLYETQDILKDKFRRSRS